MEMKLDCLPDDCIAHVLSFTEPRDACRSSIASSTVRRAAESDTLWEKFLPPDYRQIISRLTFPSSFTSKKDLYMNMSTPLLIDGGTKTISIDKESGKKIVMLSARELHITWSTNSLYWSWKPLLKSRFAEVTELVMVCWLEISAKMNTRILSPNTTYGAYLIVKFAKRAFGLDLMPSEVSVELGNHQLEGVIYLRENGLPQCVFERRDGWKEIEIGCFYCDGIDREVKMSLREVKGEHLKGGLIVEGIEIRPKQ